jgi:hypothetical protein
LFVAVATLIYLLLVQLAKGLISRAAASSPRVAR